MYLTQAGIFDPLRFSVSRIALFSARDSVGGGPYVIEAVFPFA
ncbi:hypothetical protein AEGHOMDF_2768 [Methylobacterium soli]|nr:hypothetical protein AEGHOMDF_2768 [Methylobacterium soli]